MEIIKEFNEQYNFWTVKCAEGHRITAWKEGDPIEEYNSFIVAYCPKDVDFDQFHCVTEEEDARLMKLQMEALENENNKAE